MGIEELKNKVNELLKLCIHARYDRKRLYLDIGERMFRIFLLENAIIPY